MIRTETLTIKVYKGEGQGYEFSIEETSLHEVVRGLIELIGVNEAEIMVDEILEARDRALREAEEQARRDARRCPSCGSGCQPGHCINVPA